MHYTAICQPINRSTTAILHLRPTHTHLHLHLHLPDGWIIVTDCTHAPGTTARPGRRVTVTHPATLYGAFGWLVILLSRVRSSDPTVGEEWNDDSIGPTLSRLVSKQLPVRHGQEYYT